MQIALFHTPDSYWRSPESGDLWYKSGVSKTRICRRGGAAAAGGAETGGSESSSPTLFLLHAGGRQARPRGQEELRQRVGQRRGAARAAMRRWRPWLCVRRREARWAAGIGVCYRFYHFRFYQFGPDSSAIGPISFVPISYQRSAAGWVVAGTATMQRSHYTLSPRPYTLSPRLNPTHYTLNPQPSTPTPKPSTRNLGFRAARRNKGGTAPGWREVALG